MMTFLRDLKEPVLSFRRRVIEQYGGRILLAFLGILAMVGVPWLYDNFWPRDRNFPPLAMRIDGEAAWWTTSNPPSFVILAHRERFVPCPGATLKRWLVYGDERPNRPAVAIQAPRTANLTATPYVTNDSPRSSTFALQIAPADRHNLQFVRWELYADAQQCEDGQARNGQPIGLVAIPPYPDDVPEK